MTSWSEAEPLGFAAFVFTFKNQTLSKTIAAKAWHAFSLTTDDEHRFS